MKNILMTALLTLLPLTVSAETLSLKAKCTVGGEYVEFEQEEAEADGWKFIGDNEDDAYVLEVTTDMAQLPLNHYLGDLAVSVSKTGLVEIGMSVGDSDASADASIQLPSKDGKFLPIETQFNVSGGDHASGMWNFNCATDITVK